MELKLLVLSFLIAPQFVLAKESKDLSTLFTKISALSPQERVIESTEFFLGTPTGINPLGEGQGIDPQPRFSIKKFDCTTFVETNLALAFAKSPEDVEPLMDKIRYVGDKTTYFERSHFMVTDWIPANSKKGFVSEITQKLAPDKTVLRPEKKPLNKTLWFYHQTIDLLDQQKKTPAEILAQLSQIPVLPPQEEVTTSLSAAYFRDNEKSMMEMLPEVSIVMFIRNLPNTPTVVNHMGFVIKKKGALYLRHSPQARPWKVMEIALDDYFKDMDAHRAAVEGLLFLEIGAGPGEVGR